MSVRINISAQTGDFRLRANFAIPDGSVTAVFGPSGAGKTTLLRAIAGLQHSFGLISVGNTNWQDDSQRLPIHERDMGFVFQKANLFRHLSVAGNLEYGYNRTPPDKRLIKFQEAINLLDLSGLLDRPPETLSGGEQQRVAIARALLRNPKLLALDEPLAALDQNRKDEILSLLRQLQAKLAIPMLYVSHDINEVARIADQLLLLDGGEVTASGDIHELLTRLDLPLARDVSGGSVIDATVAEYDSGFDLTRARFDGGYLQLPGNHGGAGQPLRLVILARDVSLSLERHSNTSILNVLDCRVTEIAADESSQAIVKLDAGGSPLLARITRKSLSDLGVEPGSHLFAQVKTVALIS